jgi:hypothetical protein
MDVVLKLGTMAVMKVVGSALLGTTTDVAMTDVTGAVAFAETTALVETATATAVDETTVSLRVALATALEEPMTTAEVTDGFAGVMTDPLPEPPHVATGPPGAV